MDNIEETVTPLETIEVQTEDTQTPEVAEELVDGVHPDVLAIFDGEASALEPTEEVTEETVEESAEEVEVEVKEDARFSKAFSQLTKREKEITQREESLKVSSASLEKAELAAKSYKTAPVSFIKSQLEHFTGNSDPEAIDDAFHDLYEAMTLHVLGEDAPGDMQEQSQYQRLQRDFDSYKQAQLEEKQELESSVLDSQRNAKVVKAQADIKDQLSSTSQQYPYLLNQQDQSPEELVFDLVFQDYNRQLESGVEDPVAMTIQEAANQANTHFKSIAHKWASIIPNAPEAKPTSTGLPDNNRPGNSRTLTNSNASVAPTSEASPYIDDDDESKMRAIDLLFR